MNLKLGIVEERIRIIGLCWELNCSLMSYLIDYLVEESLSDFSALIGKRKLLI